MSEIAQQHPITPPVAAEPKKNVFSRIAGVLFAPASTFQEIARRPDIVAPLAIIVILAAISTFVLVPKMNFEETVRQQIQQSGRTMSSDDLDRAARVGGALAKVMAYASPAVTIIAFAVIAGILLLAFRMFGGEGTFKQAFSATIYAWIPFTLKSILMAVVALTRDTIDAASAAATLVKSNPAFLLDMKEHPVLFSLLSSLDVFTIWTVILLIIGFAALSKASKARAAAIVISLWAAVLFVKLGVAAVSASKMKS